MEGRNKTSFVLYTESLNVLDVLTDEQSGRLFRAIREYIKNGTLPEDQIIRVAFSNIKDYLDKDAAKYQKICQRNRDNGILGGRPPKKPKEETQINPNKPSGFLGNPKNLESESDSDSDSESVSESDIGIVAEKPQQKKRTRFTPPTVEQVYEYCQERQNTVDPERFVNFYESKGWLVGKSKMKDWKAAVRSWERNSEQRQHTDPLTEKLERLKTFGGGDFFDFNQ